MSVSHVMQEPPHPGAVVLHECMEPLGLAACGESDVSTENGEAPG